MPRIAVPDGQDPLMHLWAGTGTALTGPAAKFSDAVYNRSTLPVREFEAARITIARINDCNICQTLRTPEGPGEAFYDTVLGKAGSADEQLTEREALAAEFAHRFATDHLNMDDASGSGCTQRSPTTSSSSSGCASARGWRSAGSTGSSTWTGSAGSRPATAVSDAAGAARCRAALDRGPPGTAPRGLLRCRRRDPGRQQRRRARPGGHTIAYERSQTGALVRQAQQHPARSVTPRAVVEHGLG